MPPSLEDKPELQEFEHEYASAFMVLSNGRQSDQPIRLTEIEAYVRLYGALDTDAFVRIIRIMDAAFMDFIQRKRDRK